MIVVVCTFSPATCDSEPRAEHNDPRSLAQMDPATTGPTPAFLLIRHRRYPAAYVSGLCPQTPGFFEACSHQRDTGVRYTTQVCARLTISGTLSDARRGNETRGLPNLLAPKSATAFSLLPLRLARPKLGAVGWPVPADCRRPLGSEVALLSPRKERGAFFWRTFRDAS